MPDENVMTVTVHPTDKLVMVNGCETRVWEGRTGNGVPVHMMVAMIGCDNGLNHEEFERDLLRVAVVSRDVDRSIPRRLDTRKK